MTVLRPPIDVLRLYGGHDGSIQSALQSRLGRGSLRPFMLFEDRTWSWGQFAEASERLATALLAKGIGHGDRVAVVGRNSDGHVLLLFALARIGAVMVPVNPEFGDEEMRYVLHHADIAGIVGGSGQIETIRDASINMARKPWLIGLERGTGALTSVWDYIAAAEKPPRDQAGGPNDTCLIIYTSGTTGFPKGVMHSQRSFVLAGEAFVQRVWLQEDDRVMIVLPMYHMNALFYSVSGTLAAGAGMAIVPKFSASSFWHTAVETGATEVNIIEAIGSILKARPRSEFRPEHKIRAVYGVRQNVAETFRGEFGIRHLVSGYGMSEIPGVTCTPYEGPSKPGSMGPVGSHPDPARRWAECRVVDEDGRDVPPGDVGELWVKTPILMQGYFRDPEQTAASFCDGWFMTGDLVRRDEDGWFYFVSRKTDIIRRRGENIAGAELDRVIGEHPGVLDTAAIAVPAELGEDEILVAVVAAEKGSLSVDDITDWCRNRLAPMKVPRYIVFCDELPHTPTHKVAKAALRNDPGLLARAVDLQRCRGDEIEPLKSANPDSSGRN